MLRKSLLLVYAVNILLLAGCATLNKTQSGFLKDYKGFVNSSYFPGALADNRNLAKMNNYRKYLIEPVVIYYYTQEKSNVPQDVAQDIAAYFTNEIIKNLQDKYEVVHVAGPGVLRIRIAITDIAASQPLLNIAPSTKLSGMGTGGACIEGEAVDSVTGERIAAFVDCRKGNQWDIAGGLDEWQYAKDACASWARDLRSRFDIGFENLLSQTKPNSNSDADAIAQSAAENAGNDAAQ